MKKYKIELEVKHLAPYLPYKIKGRSRNTGTIFTITGFNDRNSITTYGDLGMSDFEGTELLLHSFSDLKKQEFKNLVDELDRISFGTFSELFLEKNALKMPYILVEILFENHFDLFGLIEKGLAVDINTLSVSL